MRRWVTRTFWSTYRDSPPVRQEIERQLQRLEGGGKGLNVGAGQRSPDRRLLNIDRSASMLVDCIADAKQLPFATGAFRLVLSQEVVEHVSDPFLAVNEMGRVLEAGGALYLQVPFIIGYHPEPDDYWRFSHAGLRQLIEQAGLSCERVEVAYGPGTGAYRIAVELVAGMAARFLPGAYSAVKGLFSIVLFPLRWLDRWLSRGPQRHRIVGGYYGVGRKPG